MEWNEMEGAGWVCKPEGAVRRGVLDELIHSAITRRLVGMESEAGVKVGMAVARQAEVREFGRPFER
jgi:hypothetical protein